LFLVLALDFLGNQSFQAEERTIWEICRLFKERHLTSFFHSTSVKSSGSIRWEYMKGVWGVDGWVADGVWGWRLLRFEFFPGHEFGFVD
jgi:hypothetical protein